MSAQKGSGESSPDVLQMALVEGEEEGEAEGEGGMEGGRASKLHHWGPTVKGSVSKYHHVGSSRALICEFGENTNIQSLH